MGQTSGATSTQPPPQNMAEDEPQLDFGTLRTTLIVLQEELPNLRANKENVAEMMRFNKERRPAPWRQPFSWYGDNLRQLLNRISHQVHHHNKAQTQVVHLNR